MLPSHKVKWKCEFLVLESIFVSAIQFLTTILWLHNRIKVKTLKKAIATLSLGWDQEIGQPANSREAPRAQWHLPWSCPPVSPLGSYWTSPEQNLSLMENWDRPWFGFVTWKKVFLELSQPSSFHLSWTVSEARSPEVGGCELTYLFQNLVHSLLFLLLLSF